MKTSGSPIRLQTAWKGHDPHSRSSESKESGPLIEKFRLFCRLYPSITRRVVFRKSIILRSRPSTEGISHGMFIRRPNIHFTYPLFFLTSRTGISSLPPRKREIRYKSTSSLPYRTFTGTRTRYRDLGPGSPEGNVSVSRISSPTFSSQLATAVIPVGQSTLLRQRGALDERLEDDGLRHCLQ